LRWPVSFDSILSANALTVVGPSSSNVLGVVPSRLTKQYSASARPLQYWPLSQASTGARAPAEDECGAQSRGASTDDYGVVWRRFWHDRLHSVLSFRMFVPLGRIHAAPGSPCFNRCNSSSIRKASSPPAAAVRARRLSCLGDRGRDADPALHRHRRRLSDGCFWSLRAPGHVVGTAAAPSGSHG
jgi:hypothetical protein